VDLLTWIQNWYYKHCDGDWEHEYGVKIDTLDNPGWAVDIDLVDTDLESASFERIEVERSEQDWVHCSVQEQIFRGRGGPKNLEDILEIFRQWASRTENARDHNKEGLTRQG